MLARLKGAVAENWRWVLQMQHVLRSGLALRIKFFDSTGGLIQLPLSSECGCFVPSWFLAPKARQRNLSVHGGEGSEKPQAFCPSRKSAQPTRRRALSRPRLYGNDRGLLVSMTQKLPPQFEGQGRARF